MRNLVIALFAFCAPAAYADDPAFVPGRPGATESPISVPKGYWQIETELAGFTRDREDGVTTHSTSLFATDLRYGIANGWDAEVIAQPYLRERSDGVTTTGFGDLTVRTRRTLMGQDGNGPALAVIGFVTLPTSTHGLGEERVQGGAILTGSTALNDKFSLTGTFVAATADYGADDRQGEFSLAANLTYALTDKVGLYGELAGTRDQHDTRTAATFDFGATFLANKTTQLDVGANLGITGAADDAKLFLGWAHRF